MLEAGKIALVALTLALDVFAVSVGVGVAGVTTSAKLRIGAAFATAEVTMNLIGAGLGAVAGKFLGDIAGYIGFVALVLLGFYMIYESRTALSGSSRFDLSQGRGLFIAALAISLDSLGIGFSILYIGVPLTVSLCVIAAVSILATFAGLTLGARLGSYAERNAGLIGGILLALTGLAFIAFKALHVG